MIFINGQLIVYDKLDENSEKKAHLFFAQIANAVKQSKGEA